MDRNSKIYVAGHRGLVGSAILRKLREKQFTNLITKTSKQLDLRIQKDTGDFFANEKPDYVFLAAAKVGGILANNTYKAEFIYDNIMIAANVIHSAYKNGVIKLLNLGSSCIYPKLAPQPMKEDYLLTGLLEPTNEPYAIAKISAIKLCRYYNEQYGSDFVSVMPTNLYGPHDNFNLETAHVPPALIRKFHLAQLLHEKRYDAIKKDLQKYPLGFNLNLNLNLDIDLILKELGVTPEYVKLWGSGRPYREFLYVDDLADACVFLMENHSHREIGEFVNIGTGSDITIKGLADLVAETVGFKGRIDLDLTKPDGMPRKLLDVSKIKALGWQPKISLKDGIRKTYEWYVSS
ncbi:MAG: GDP-L-fucose synthase [Thermodesulfovibrionales bacterium]